MQTYRGARGGSPPSLVSHLVVPLTVLSPCRTCTLTMTHLCPHLAYLYHTAPRHTCTYPLYAHHDALVPPLDVLTPHHVIPVPSLDASYLHPSCRSFLCSLLLCSWLLGTPSPCRTCRWARKLPAPRKSPRTHRPDFAPA